LVAGDLTQLGEQREAGFAIDLHVEFALVAANGLTGLAADGAISWSGVETQSGQQTLNLAHDLW